MYKLNYLPTFSPLYKITKPLHLIPVDSTNSGIIVFIHFVHYVLYNNCTPFCARIYFTTTAHHFVHVYILQLHIILGRYTLYNCTPLITTPDSGQQYLLYFSRVVCSVVGAMGSAVFAHTSPKEDYWLKSVLGCTFSITDPDIINLV